MSSRIAITSPKTNGVKSRGNFKEIFSGPHAYNQIAEEQGTEEYAKASVSFLIRSRLLLTFSFQYPNYLPTWDHSEKYPPLEPFDHYDRGLDADRSFRDLIPSGTKVEELTPTMGSIISGVQLSSLNSSGKNQLALLTAERKVVVFRAQNFADLPIEEAIKFGAYFGRLHIMNISPCPKGYPEVHLVHVGAGDTSVRKVLEGRTSSVVWHSDVTNEEQPPGTTIMYILDTPDTGGDTLFVDMVEAYNRLSPSFQQRLHGLKAIHSGVEQAESQKSLGGICKRDPVLSEHPIVRTHPVTGEKALYVNAQYTRHIVGYKKEESDALLKFLYDHIAFGADFQLRVKWEKGTVVVFDNRVTGHSPLVDFQGQRRHLARLTPQAERPYETPFIDEPLAATNGK
ncbi:hypothetical protein MMC17_001037 [Xylographa soralifera]|nr:hypothetical protein [Xylographa soralifera]